MKIELPESVLDFTSTNVPEPEVVLGYLPKDTSFADRYYLAPDGFWVNVTIILMGRTGRAFTGRITVSRDKVGPSIQKSLVTYSHRRRRGL